jgi:4-amino-4-deoxy-L-arabinose transferase-like glycosyltransferase
MLQPRDTSKPRDATAARRMRLGLAAIVTLALALRLWWVLSAGRPVPLVDPDDYVSMAKALADGHHPWHWTFDAVRYWEFYRAPLYQLFLSLFTARPDWFPLSVVFVNALLDALLCLSFYWLGRSLHSARAGLVAAAVYALWLPRIAMIGSIRQEQLFLPLLVTGFAFLASAFDRPDRSSRWVVAGAVLGLAALTRSSVAYFVLAGALLHVLMSRDRGRAWRQCVPWVGAFMLVVVPYVALVSVHAGRFLLVEDIGYFNLKRSAGEGGHTLASYMVDDSRGPTVVEAARYLAAVARDDPAGFVTSRADYLRLLIKPLSNIRGIVARTPGRALAAKWIVHVVADAPFMMAVLLAPLGVALARRKEVACLLALWVVLYSASVSVMLWAGGRWRLPIEPACLALAAVVAAGGWVRPKRVVLVLAAAASVVVGIALAFSLPDVLAARANYGVTSGPVGPAPTDLVVVGRAGVNVLTAQPAIALTLRADPAMGQSEPVRVVVRVSGRQADEVLVVGDQPRRVTYVVDPGVYYLELVASAADGSAATVAITLP